ncbi:hypothetical protein E4T38_07291 [Aureobasidium subglaciale]|nr:hypothetical protein E4T38_07291 [Aureobasidium subglaciale]KAI5217635.1 hypothetical protein E4T40_07302 [Aureobasidium subglaciale]KAI5221226.1 hypothetical protein E4T41_07143 [Aureobasidium subglaciale]KAI5258912.1 hypothetical protein E4T46_07120 [Aureobasidium subglaciale]
MAQTYQKGHYDYDGMQQSERRPSRGPIHAGVRGVPYVPYTTRPDPRNESRTYVLATPIYDIDQDSDQGSARKRTSMAVGTSQTFDLDTSVGGPSPMAPISPYSPVSSNGGGYPAYPTDNRSSSVPAHGRSGYSQTSLPAYTYDIDTPTYALSDESRAWTSGNRTGTAVSYYQQEGSSSYEYPTPVSKISSDSNEPLSPLNMSTLQSSLPLPLERRLPAPNFVGTSITPDNDIRSPISARLSSLSISGPYSRSNSGSWAVDGVERRQPSIHDLAEASMMLPPVTRGLVGTSANLPALGQDATPMSTAMFVSTPNDNLAAIQTSTGAAQPTYYTATSSSLPSLNTGMLLPTNYARYTAINNSDPSLPNMNTNDRTDPTSYYGWGSTTASGTEVLPILNTVEATTQSTAGADRKYTSAQVSARYPPLQHPEPKIVPSTPHATTLERHGRTQQKDDKQHRPSSGSGQQKNTSGSLSSNHGKKSGHEPSKGSL